MKVFNGAQVERPIWPELKQELQIVLARASLLNGQLRFRHGQDHSLAVSLMMALKLNVPHHARKQEHQMVLVRLLSLNDQLLFRNGQAHYWL